MSDPTVYGFPRPSQFRNPIVRKTNENGRSPRTSRKAGLALLLLAGLSLMVSLLALAFDSSVFDPFPPSAPPM